MLHHMDRGNWYVSVYHINCLSGLHKGFINLERSNRGSLPLVIKCKILSGHETLEGSVTTCWITGVGGGGSPTYSALNCSMSKTHGLSPEGEQISTAWPTTDTSMLKMVTFAQLHAMCYNTVCGLLWLKVANATLSWSYSSRRFPEID